MAHRLTVPYIGVDFSDTAVLAFDGVQHTPSTDSLHGVVMRNTPATIRVGVYRGSAQALCRGSTGGV